MKSLLLKVVLIISVFNGIVKERRSQRIKNPKYDIIDTGKEEIGMMKEEYIRNGIIYIQRGPRPFHLKEAQHEEMMKELKEEIESGESEELSKEQLEDLKQFKLI